MLGDPVFSVWHTDVCLFGSEYFHGRERPLWKQWLNYRKLYMFLYLCVELCFKSQTQKEGCDVSV